MSPNFDALCTYHTVPLFRSCYTKNTGLQFNMKKPVNTVFVLGSYAFQVVLWGFILLVIGLNGLPLSSQTVQR